MQHSGTLGYDQTWSGAFDVDGNVTVPAGVTLYVEDGTTISVPPNCSITAEGALVAVGTPTNRITFTRSGTSGSWGGIHFQDSSEDDACKLEHCIIEYATDGVVCDHASPTIHSCTIRRNSTGMRIIGSGPDVQHCRIYSNSTGVYMYPPGATLEFKNNRLYYNSTYGMFLSHTDNWIHDNNLYNNTSGSSGTGIYCYRSNPQLEQDTVKYSGSDGIRLYYSSPYLQEEVDLLGRNVIAYNWGDGIRVDGTSHPVLSVDDEDNPANNSIYSNEGREVYSLQSSEIVVTWNWWGQYPPNSAEFYGNVRVQPALWDNPNSEPNRGIPKRGEGKPLADAGGLESTGSDSARAYYDAGTRYELIADWDRALAAYQTLLSRWPESVEALMAVARLGRCYRRAGLKVSSLVSYLSALASEKAACEVAGRAEQLVAAHWLKEGRYEEALAKYQELRRRFPQSRIARESLFDQWQILFNVRSDLQAARVAMVDYEKSYGDDDFLGIMKICMGEAAPEQERELARRSGSSEGLPQSFALLPAYPNPFNPSATLRYELPEPAHVRIEVFDVVGRRVAVLVDAQKPAGRHAVRWNGRDEHGRPVASGTYLVRMRAGSRVVARKITLLR